MTKELLEQIEIIESALHKIKSLAGVESGSLSVAPPSLSILPNGIDLVLDDRANVKKLQSLKDKGGKELVTLFIYLIAKGNSNTLVTNEEVKTRWKKCNVKKIKFDGNFFDYACTRGFLVKKSVANIL